MLTLATLLFLAQTVTPSTVAVYGVQGRPRDGGNINFEIPPAPTPVVLTVVATGSWSATVGGSLANQGDFGGPNISVSPSSGTAGTTSVTITFGNVWMKSPGAYHGTVTIGTTVVPVLLQITPPRPVLSMRGSAPGGCTTSNQHFPWADNCTVPSAGSVPAAGSSYVNAFGGSLYRINASNISTFYSARQPYSRSGRYLMVADTSNGGVKVFDTTTWTEPFTGLTSAAINSLMSQYASDTDGTIYYQPATGSNRGQIRKLVPPSGTDSLVLDLGAAPYNLDGTIDQNAGATTGMIGSWMVAGARDTGGGQPLAADRVCAVDVSVPAAYCSPAGDLRARINSFDFAAISPADRQGRRWVMVEGEPAAIFYRVTATGLEYDFTAGEYSGAETCSSNCLSTPHAALGLDEAGDVVVFSLTNSPLDSYIFATAYRVADGVKMMRSARRLIPLGPPNGTFDMHFSWSEQSGRFTASPYQAIGQTAQPVDRELFVWDPALNLVIRPGHIPTDTTDYYSSPRCSLGPTGKKASCAAKWGAAATTVYEVTIP